jgi:hypothetical protein
MGARVVGGGGIGAGDGSLATVVGSCPGGRCGSTVLTVAGNTGTGCAVVVGIAVDIAGDFAVDTVVDGGVESLGAMISYVRWAGCSSTITVATATAIVASTTPMRTIRLDHRPSSSSCSGAPGVTSSPLPADSSTSSGSNR